MIEGCQVIGFDWTCRFVNAAALAHVGRTEADLLGRTLMECFPEVETIAAFALLRRCMHLRTSERTEQEFRCADGSLRRFALRFHPVPDGVCILTHDLSDR